MSNDPLSKCLSRFTPDASGLDRDALLFAAGRASTRPNRGWQMLAAALAATQLLTLAMLFWPRAMPPVFVPSQPDAPLAPLEPTPPPVSEPPSLLALRDRVIAAEGNLPFAAPAKALPPTDPPLRAFGPLPLGLQQSSLFSKGE